MRRRLIIAVVVLLALSGVTAIVWTALDWPPPRLILKYGLPPVGGPTGNEWTSPTGYTFVEVASGYCRVKWRVVESEGDWLGRICGAVGLPFGDRPRLTSWSVDEWVEIEEPFWISTIPVHYGLEKRATGPTEPYDVWLSAHEGRRYRTPTESELLFAAGRGVWPEYHLFVKGKDAMVPLGAKWRGFDGSAARFWRNTGEQDIEMGTYRQRWFPHLPEGGAFAAQSIMEWHDPPLIWIPPENPD